MTSFERGKGTPKGVPSELAFSPPLQDNLIIRKVRSGNGDINKYLSTKTKEAGSCEVVFVLKSNLFLGGVPLSNKSEDGIGELLMDEEEEEKGDAEERGVGEGVGEEETGKVKEFSLLGRKGEGVESLDGTEKVEIDEREEEALSWGRGAVVEGLSAEAGLVFNSITQNLI